MHSTYLRFPTTFERHRPISTELVPDFSVQLNRFDWLIYPCLLATIVPFHCTVSPLPLHSCAAHNTLLLIISTMTLTTLWSSAVSKYSYSDAAPTMDRVSSTSNPPSISLYIVRMGNGDVRLNLAYAFFYLLHLSIVGPIWSLPLFFPAVAPLLQRRSTDADA